MVLRPCHRAVLRHSSRLTLCDPTDPASLPRPWDSAGKITGVGCPARLQGIFLTQGLKLNLLHLLQLAGWFFTTTTT